MTETSVKRFQQEAERCRAEAARAAGEADRTAWLRMANDWARLAKDAVLANRRRMGERPKPRPFRGEGVSDMLTGRIA